MFALIFMSQLSAVISKLFSAISRLSVVLLESSATKFKLTVLASMSIAKLKLFAFIPLFMSMLMSKLSFQFVFPHILVLRLFLLLFLYYFCQKY